MDDSKSVDLIDLDNLLGSNKITTTRDLIDVDGFKHLSPPVNYTSVDWLRATTYGSLINTLVNEGMKAEQIIEVLTRKTGVKGHVNGHLDIDEVLSQSACFPA
jgi:hypothetical protein